MTVTEIASETPFESATYTMVVTALESETETLSAKAGLNVAEDDSTDEAPAVSFIDATKTTLPFPACEVVAVSDSVAEVVYVAPAESEVEIVSLATPPRDIVSDSVVVVVAVSDRESEKIFPLVWKSEVAAVSEIDCANCALEDSVLLDATAVSDSEAEVVLAEDIDSLDDIEISLRVEAN